MNTMCGSMARGLVVAVLAAALLPACSATQPAVLVRLGRVVALPSGFAAVPGETEAASGLPRRIRQVALDYELVLVPAGAFKLTTYDTLTGAKLVRADSLPAFYIGTAPVTNVQYWRYRPAHTSAPGESNPLNADTAPVLDIHWQQAMDFCAWAGMALPGETQWLKAVHGTRPRREGRGHAAGTHYLVPPRPAYPEWCTDSAVIGYFPRNAADTAVPAAVVSGGIGDVLNMLTDGARAAGLVGGALSATPVGWAYLGFSVLDSFPDWFVATRGFIPVRCE